MVRYLLKKGVTYLPSSNLEHWETEPHMTHLALTNANSNSYCFPIWVSYYYGTGFEHLSQIPALKYSIHSFKCNPEMRNQSYRGVLIAPLQSRLMNTVTGRCRQCICCLHGHNKVKEITLLLSNFCVCMNYENTPILIWNKQFLKCIFVQHVNPLIRRNWNLHVVSEPPIQGINPD